MKDWGCDEKYWNAVKCLNTDRRNTMRALVTGPGVVGARIMDEPGQDAVNGISGQIQAAKIGKGIEAIHTRIIISHYLQSDQNAGDS